jgi:hypothetical protein
LLYFAARQYFMTEGKATERQRTDRRRHSDPRIVQARSVPV